MLHNKNHVISIVFEVTESEFINISVWSTIVVNIPIGYRYCVCLGQYVEGFAHQIGNIRNLIVLNLDAYYKRTSIPFI